MVRLHACDIRCRGRQGGWGEPVGVRRSCFGFALLAPEGIAGSVKKDEPSLGIGIGHRGVGLTANQARVRQGSFNADPSYPFRGRKSPLASGEMVGRSPEASRRRILARSSWWSTLRRTARRRPRSVSQYSCVVAQGHHQAPASNRQDTRHSRLQTMLDAEPPDKLLAHLSRCTDDRHEAHPLSVIRYRDQLLRMSTPVHEASHSEEGQPIWRRFSYRTGAGGSKSSAVRLMDVARPAP